MDLELKDFIYLTDVNFVSDIEKAKMHDADLIILDALRIKEHVSHYSLGEALSLIKELKPKKALFTHISHYMGLHKDVNMSLPENILSLMIVKLFYLTNFFIKNKFF